MTGRAGRAGEAGPAEEGGWAECGPGQAGVASRGVDQALDLVRKRGATAQLCVLRDGKVVLDRAVGCGHGALFWIFSASKPFVALLVHLLAQRGELVLDDRVARYWPGFGQRGKELITIRQVLQHRSGLAVACSAALDALARGGELGGARVLDAATIEQARQPSSDGETDRFLGLPIRWSQGFQLGGPVPDPGAPRPMGRLSSPQAFGHNGSNCCIAWADPAHRLVFVYLIDRLETGPEGARHLGSVSDAITAACS